MYKKKEKDKKEEGRKGTREIDSQTIKVIYFPNIKL